MENNATAISPLSWGKKLSEHWGLLIAAVFFDILALVPFISIVFNLCFAGILYLYFAFKGKSDFLKTGIGIAMLSIVDLIISILPVNTGAAVYKILSKT